MPRDRQEVEDPAAAVVHHHDRRLHAQAARREQPVHVVVEADVAGQHERAPRGDGRRAETGRDQPVDAVRAAVGEEPQRRGWWSGRNVSRSRIGMLDATYTVLLVGQQRAEVAVHARLEQLVAELA